MMKSMTGFGRAETTVAGSSWAVECSSVNRKQLEVVVSLPRELAELEPQVRALVSQRLSRGRVSVSLRLHGADAETPGVTLNEALAAEYMIRLRRLSQQLGLPDDLSMADLLRCPGVLAADRSTPADAEAWATLEPLLLQALKQLVEMRSTEGSHLAADITQRMDHIAKLLDQVATLAPSVPEQHRRALQQRLADAGLNLDPKDERVLKELALYADRCDISEEITRIRSHLGQFQKLSQSQDAQGRALDFLLQEFGREWNTLGNKANSADISPLIVAAKAELEKIREQVQNVE